MKTLKNKNLPTEKKNSFILYFSLSVFFFTFSSLLIYLSNLDQSYSFYKPVTAVVSSFVFVCFFIKTISSWINVKKFKNLSYSTVWNEISSILKIKEYWVQSASKKTVGSGNSGMERHSYEIVLSSTNHFLCFHCDDDVVACKRVDKISGQVIEDPDLAECFDWNFSKTFVDIAEDFIENEGRNRKANSFFNNISEYLKNKNSETEQEVSNPKNNENLKVSKNS